MAYQKKIKEKELILKKNNCDENQIINIISSNPMYLDKTNDIVLRLISKLKSYGFSMLNILFDSNPILFNEI